MHAAESAPNPSINVPNFGATQRGANMKKPVVVALLDTAVDYQHPDLKNVLYHVTAQQQAALGCGEYGYKAGDKGAHGNDYDLESLAIGGGTHTAGILGAEWNGFGTSSVASDVRIVSIDFSGENLSVSIADAICAFNFVDRFNEQASEDERIRVTNNSWGCAQSSRALDAAVRQRGEKWGIVSVFSAGNDGRQRPLRAALFVSGGQSLRHRRRKLHGRRDPACRKRIRHRDGSDVFEPYEKRSSEDCVYSQAACSYRGRLFVIGSAIFEPDNRIFRATAMEMPEYPSDIPCEDESKEPTNPEMPTDPKDSGSTSKSPSRSNTTRKTPGAAVKSSAKTSASPLAKMGDLFNGSSAAVLAGAGLGFLFVGRRVSRRRFS